MNQNTNICICTRIYELEKSNYHSKHAHTNTAKYLSFLRSKKYNGNLYVNAGFLDTCSHNNTENI